VSILFTIKSTQEKKPSRQYTHKETHVHLLRCVDEENTIYVYV